MTARVIEVLRSRATDTRRLYDALNTTVADERLPLEYRKSEAARLIAEIHERDERAQQELSAAVQEATRKPAARVAEGIAFATDELIEAGALRDQYRDTPGQLPRIAASAIEAGATRRARVAYKAAAMAGQPVENLERALMSTDRELVAAVTDVRAVEHLASTMAADIARERAQAHRGPDGQVGTDGVDASIAAKTYAQLNGYPPEAAESGPSFLERLGSGQAA